jgi:uncharacterized protein YcsI (UPF0317 family)
MSSALKVRLEARSGRLTTTTTGLAKGHIQANLIVLPADVAGEFELLAARNPVPCPILGKTTTPGDPHSFTPSSLFQHGEDPSSIIDIRTDLPSYNVFEAGQLIATKQDIKSEWNESSVALLVGCSFSFETALHNAGLTPRSMELGQNVPIYITNVRLMPAGIFTGSTMVVSMRPYREEDIERVRDITRPYTTTHGEPVAWGWEGAKALGITDIDKPDFGVKTVWREGEMPVFWVCSETLHRGSTDGTGLRRDTASSRHGGRRQDSW